MADVKRKELMIAGKELNILLDPDPKIKMVGVKNEVLLKNIKDAGKLIAADDEISQEVMDTLKEIGIEIPEGVLISQGETPKEEKKDPSPKSEEKAKSSEPTFEELSAAALDMNEIMGLEPAINPEGMDIEDLKLAIINECYDDKEICEVYTTDEFTKETWAVLNSQGIRAVDPKEVAGSTEKEETPKEEKEAKSSKDSKKDSKKDKKSTPRTSNKSVVYAAWKAGITNTEELHKTVKEAVKIGTIRSWIGGWKNGKNLPAGV